ncbi:AraC family transcriptional regulator [Piscinibacter terrae]|uniref:AraC family transcriptional regulator n=1 Tax=Piscinibacter terrae TaxID=2496871 RepID=A0A3N7HPB1_9BURK|nr:helix-turn-helix transcriptional regulator [Albitalea terrae]RQP23533.1 AraC family transcriptional regulator [Albitalea terrae]
MPATIPLGPLTPHLYAPSKERPVRAKVHRLRTDQRVVPHDHPWAQVAVSATGVVRLTVQHGTYIAPPSRAVWIPAGVQHAVSVVEDADLRTLYLYQPAGRCGPDVARSDENAWRQCRVLEVSDLLRALVLEMDTTPDDGPQPAQGIDLVRERHLSALVLDELRRAKPVRLGVALPADKRLRTLCEAVLDDPVRHATLDDWARNAGASPRTVARLFRQELGTTFVQWRHQVLLAKALAMAARKLPMGTIAAELGYASPSAFTAMVRRSVGAPPSEFFQ